MTTESKKSQYVLLFHHSVEGPDPSPAEMELIMGRWMAWMKSIGGRGQMVGHNRLQDTGKVLRGPGGKAVTDGPYVESKEIVGGYILINADNYAEAVEIARGCPGLDDGIAVEVRAVEPLSEL